MKKIPYSPTATDIIEIILYDLVNSYFKSDLKTKRWFRAKNPLLGNVSPLDMINRGRHAKLLMFIRLALDENRREIK